VAVLEDGESKHLNLSRVTGDFFQVLGVVPISGRALTRADDIAGRTSGDPHAPAVVARYRGSRDTIGRRLIFGRMMRSPT
jgi:hypothetical protein